LFRDSALRVMQASEAIGIRGMLAHAISNEAKAFYLALGLSEIAADGADGHARGPPGHPLGPAKKHFVTPPQRSAVPKMCCFSATSSVAKISQSTIFRFMLPAFQQRVASPRPELLA
jgi:hypothetical protein